MADMIKCPVCGENNRLGQEFCLNCQTRLGPVPGSSKGDETLKPGQAPTKKNTADLEPILPQWLKDARDSARNIGSGDVPAEPSTPKQTQPASPVDFLAGLHSQADDNDEEDIPDWLANITGDAPKSKKSQPEPSEVRWVEMGEKNDFVQDEQPAAESDTPPWLAGLASNAPQTEKDELTDWFRDASGIQKPAEAAPSSSVDSPDWLRSMAAEDGQGGFTSSSEPADTFGNISASADDTPDWLRAMAADNEAKNNSQPASSSNDLFGASSTDDTPDWLRSMSAESSPQDSAPVSSSNDLFGSATTDDTPDWLRGMQAQSAEPAASSEPVSSGFPESSADLFGGNVPDWLKGTAEEKSTAAPLSEPDWLKSESENTPVDNAPDWASAGVTSGDELEMPAWLNPAESAAQPSEAQDISLGDVPDWLKASAPKETIFGETPAADPAAVPDWLNSLQSAAPESSSKPAEIEFSSTPPAEAGIDNLFTDLPDWLSKADDMAAPVSSSPSPITNTDAIAPGDLPSWVQAMRPVDSGLPTSMPVSLSSDQTLESRGALAGLQGVLPAVPGFSPASKPKAYSIRLQANEEQQSHAALLEQILAAETAPVPLSSLSNLNTSRALRWFLVAVFFLILPAILIMRTQFFALPPSELKPAMKGALDVAQLLPEGAPVLVAFDVEPARVGEMEAVAAPMFDQMLLLHHPRFTFVSTSESGAILAERFISTGPLAGHQYQSGIEYMNLGYLPGGQMGIYSFAQNPRQSAPYLFNSGVTESPLLNAYLSPAWAAEPWSGITTLSQFTAFVIVTDNADSARAWIEQTSSTRGAMPIVVISSAQAAPMIRPYFDSQQISGLVAGLYDGAVFEQNNLNRPGTTRIYWDAYNIGLLLAMVLILLGGLWNLVLGLRDRAAAREVK